MNSPGTEASNRPPLFRVGSYVVYFWINESNPLEPVHVHIAQIRPTPDATKVWITRSGKCLLQNNNSRIPERELRLLIKIIEVRSASIIEKWEETFRSIRFFC